MTTPTLPTQNLSSEPTSSPHQGEISRRTFLELSGAALLGSALSPALPSWHLRPETPAQSQNTRPNLLLIVTDQERYPQHWPEGWVEANLPNRSRLADNGISFRRAYCNAAMCSPSRATLFTGLYPAQHGVTNTLTHGGTQSPTEPSLPADIQTLGHMLASAGYNVVLKGKWHVSKSAEGELPTSDDVAAFGFQQWEPTTAGEDQGIENYGGGCANWDTTITEQAVAFLQTQTPQITAATPFALIVTLVNPHDVLAYPKDWDAVSEPGCDNYADVDFNQGIDLPLSNSADDLANKPTCQAQSRELYAAGMGPLLTPQQQRNYVNFYAALHKEVDRHIGAILDAVDAEVMEDTLVIFTSDHGELGLSHNGLRQKMYNAYEETMHIPLIFSNRQRFPAPLATDAYASLIDLMPTLASLAQVPNRERWVMQGMDLTPVLENPATSVQDVILFTFDDENAGQPDGIPINPITNKPVITQPNHLRAIRLRDEDGEWLYARYFDPNGVEAEQYEMYHLRDGTGQPVDPHEIDNLAHPNSPNYNDLFYSAKRAALAQRLAQLEDERLNRNVLPQRLFLPAVAA